VHGRVRLRRAGGLLRGRAIASLASEREREKPATAPFTAAMTGKRGRVRWAGVRLRPRRGGFPTLSRA